jgi:hypothetical protein
MPWWYYIGRLPALLLLRGPTSGDQRHRRSLAVWSETEGQLGNYSRAGGVFDRCAELGRAQGQSPGLR